MREHVLKNIYIFLTISSIFWATLLVHASDRDTAGKSFIEAVVRGDKDQCRAFIAEGADVNDKILIEGSVLHIAVQYGHYELTEMFISLGADPNVRNIYGNTPLHLAASNGDIKMCEILLSAGADMYQTNVNEEHAINVAANNNDRESLICFFKKITESRLYTIVPDPNYTGYRVKSIDFDRLGEKMVVGIGNTSSAKPVKVWDCSMGTIIDVFNGHETIYVTDAAISPDGSMIAVGEGTSSVPSYAYGNISDPGICLQVWSLYDHQLLHTANEYKGLVSDLAFHPSGQQLSVGTFYFRPSLFTIDSLSGGVLSKTEGPIYAKHLTYSTDGTLFAYVSFSENIHFELERIVIQNNTSGKTVHLSIKKFLPPALLEQAESKPYLFGLNFIQFSPADDCLLAGMDNHAWIVNTDNGELIKQINFGNMRAKDLVFTPEGDHFIAVGKNNSTGGALLQLWDYKTFDLIEEVKIKGGQLNTVKFHPGGKSFLTAGSDNKIRIWGYKPLKELGWMFVFNDAHSIIISNEGYFDATTIPARNLLRVHAGNKYSHASPFSSLLQINGLLADMLQGISVEPLGRK